MTDNNEINVTVEMHYKGVNETEIMSLAGALEKLKSSTKGSGVFNTYSRNLNSLSTVIQSLNKIRFTKMDGVATELAKLSKGLEGLSNFQNLSGTMTKSLNSLSKIPDVLAKLDDGTLNEFTNKIERLTQSLKPLHDMSGNLTKMFNSMPTAVGKSAKAMTQHDKVVQSGYKGLNGFWAILSTTRAKMLAFTYVLGRMGRAIQGWVKHHSDYVENVALFNQSMGQYAEEAGKYAQEVESLYGIDISQWVRNQGMFMSISRGMGVATDNAYKMSKSLTELAYDMTAMFNLEGGVEEAFTKLKSGITGEIEPLRNLGYALTQATLQEEAYRLGIDKRVTKMTEAEKAELRYQAIMRQSASRNVMGAMARELENPASALRILQGQFRTLARELGSLFIPMLVKVMPYIQAMTRVLINWIRALASWMGVELPKWKNTDFGSVGNAGVDAMDDFTGATDKAVGKQKELKGLLAGFDQLNVLDQNSDSGSGGGSGGGAPAIGGGGLGVDLFENKGFLDGAMKKRVEELMPQMEDLMKKIAGIGGALALAFGGAKVYNGINALNTLLGGKGLAGAFAIVSGAVSGFMAKTVVLPAILGGVTAPLWLVITAVVGIAVIIGAALAQLWKESEDFKNTFTQVWDSLKGMVEQVWAVIQPIFVSFGEIIGTMLSFAITYLWDAFKRAIGGILRVVGELWLFIEPLVTWMIKVFGILIVNALGILGAAFGAAFATIGVILGVAFDVIGWVFNFLADCIKYARENFGGFVSWLGGFFVTAFTGAFTLIGNILKGFFDIGKWVITGVIDIIKGIINFIVKVFTVDWKNAWKKVTDIFSGLFNGLKSTFSGVWDFILKLFNAGGTIFKGISEGISKIFRSVVNGLIGGINTIISAPFKTINGMLNTIRSISILGAKPFQGMWGHNPLSIPVIPKLPAYEKGTNFVPQTGLALLHKGETVVPAKQGKKYQSNEGSEDLLNETRRQNALLEAILEKDTSINLSGTKVNDVIKKVDTRRAKALGYTG